MRLRAKQNGVRAERGSVFVLVLWISFGLVVLALYFAHSMGFELRAADNRTAGAESAQAIAGAVRYISRVVTNVDTAGKFPDRTAYKAENVPVGEATFWIIGRSDQQNTPDLPAFGLVDEGAKLNLNTATADMLAMLPGMTADLAAAIVDWRDSDSNPGVTGTNANAATTATGAEDEVYGRLQPARKCKNAKFETVEELRLVYGMTMSLLYGEDANANGVLDANENDGDVSPPTDNHDGRLDPGLLEYVTVYSREPNTRSNGQVRVSINSTTTAAAVTTGGSTRGGTATTGGRGGTTGGRTTAAAAGTQVNAELASLLQLTLDTQRANQVLAALSRITTQMKSVLEFYVRSGLTTDEFALIYSDLTVSTNTPYTDGLINVNTASEAVLQCIPGIGTSNSAALITYRQSNADKLTSIAWVADAMDRNAAILAGPYITTRTFQFGADIAAVGHHGRGYQRVKFILDTTSGPAKILFRRDLTQLGWALGAQTRENILLSLNSSQ